MCHMRIKSVSIRECSKAFGADIYDAIDVWKWRGIKRSKGMGAKMDESAMEGKRRKGHTRVENIKKLIKQVNKYKLMHQVDKKDIPTLYVY